MATKHYDKLVRDRIPDIIRSGGGSCVCERVSDKQYIELLNRKLLEEVKEYLESGTVEELADISEVIRAILDCEGVTFEEFQRVRMKKPAARGGFKECILLREVTEK